jgi:hypothetical protein
MGSPDLDPNPSSFRSVSVPSVSSVVKPPGRPKGECPASVGRIGETLTVQPDSR